MKAAWCYRLLYGNYTYEQEQSWKKHREQLHTQLIQDAITEGLLQNDFDVFKNLKDV